MRLLYKKFVVGSLGTLTMLFASMCLFGESVHAAGFGADDVIRLTNADRSLVGLQPLSVSEALTQAAERKADHMAQNVYFAHTAPDGTRPWFFFEKAGYAYRYAGENLAISFTNAHDEELAWMASEKHRDNILSSKYSEIGVFVKDIDFGQRTVTVVVQLFGTRIGQQAALSSLNASSVMPQATSAHDRIGVSGDHPQREYRTIIGNTGFRSAEVNQVERGERTVSLVHEYGSWIVSAGALGDRVSFRVILFVGVVQCAAFVAFCSLVIRRGLSPNFVRV